MSVVGMRRSGRQNQKEQRFGSLALVSSALLVLDVFWQQSRDLSLFCLCANRYKMLIFLRLQTHVLCISLACERRFVWFRGKEIFNPEKVGSDVAGVSAGLLSGANALLTARRCYSLAISFFSLADTLSLWVAFQKGLWTSNPTAFKCSPLRCLVWWLKLTM